MAEYDPSRDEGYWWLFILLLVGVALLVGGPIVTWMTWQQLQVARSSSTWPQTEMTVTQGSVERKSGRRGRVSGEAPRLVESQPVFDLLRSASTVSIMNSLFTSRGAASRASPESPHEQSGFLFAVDPTTGPRIA